MNVPAVVRVDCPAKVNLFLEVQGRRPDGYHELVTVLQALDLSDSLTASAQDPGPDIELAVEGADLPTGPGNLAFDAARAFLDRFAPDRGVALRLVKRIPDRAGLGGGSSDAAGVLLALARLFPGPGRDALAEIGAALGSDVPFFLLASTALATGRGEVVRPLPTPAATWLVLFLPPFGLSTPEVYGSVRAPAPEERRGPEDLLETLDVPPSWRGLFNRLEEAAAEVEPRIGTFRSGIEERLGPGEALLMTGSGSAFFAVVGSAARAAELAAQSNRTGPGRALAVRTRDRPPSVNPGR